MIVCTDCRTRIPGQRIAPPERWWGMAAPGLCGVCGERRDRAITVSTDDEALAAARSGKKPEGPA